MAERSLNLADNILDRLLRHEIGLRRLSTHTVRKLISALNDAVPDLERQIRARVGWIAQRGFNSSDFTLQRLEANLATLRQVTREAYVAGFKEVRSDLLQLSKYEGEFMGGMLSREIRGAVGVDVGVGLPSKEMLRAIVDARPFQGNLLRDWARGLEQGAFVHVRKAIRTGLLQSESIDQIVRRVRGTRANGYADGALAIARREAETVVRTATAHVANFARDETYRENSGLIEGVQWVATLDSRTCELCAPRDGLKYTLDHKPIGHSVTWGAGPGRLHLNDRCTSTPVLKSFKDMGLDLDEIQMPGRRTRGGIVPTGTTYGDWIKRQPAAVQNQILGPKRAALLRSGQKYDDLFDDKGRWMTLDQLKEAEAA